MDEKPKWGLKEWVDNWKRVGPALQAQRDQEIRESDTARNIEQLDWSYRYARANYPVAESSGMVEFYRILLKRSP
jgi:hypothetical protein